MAQTAEHLDLLTRYHRDGDRAARDELVARLLPVVRQLARRYNRGPEPFDDLVQVGSLGLLKAIERFDIERGSSFMPYAVPTILGELKRHFRDHGWTAHVPRGMQERARRVQSTSEALAPALGRRPTADELARELGLSAAEVLDGLQAAGAYAPLSLDAPAHDDEGDGGSWLDSLSSTDPRYDRVDDVATLLPALRVLPERERLIVHLRFSEDLTQSEIAERIGISQMHVSRLLRRALGRVRTVVASQPPSNGGVLCT